MFTPSRRPWRAVEVCTGQWARPDGKNWGVGGNLDHHFYWKWYSEHPRGHMQYFYEVEARYISDVLNGELVEALAVCDSRMER